MQSQNWNSKTTTASKSDAVCLIHPLQTINKRYQSKTHRIAFISSRTIIRLASKSPTACLIHTKITDKKTHLPASAHHPNPICRRINQSSPTQRKSTTQTTKSPKFEANPTKNPQIRSQSFYIKIVRQPYRKNTRSGVIANPTAVTNTSLRPQTFCLLADQNHRRNNPKIT
jgi:hypothetical protein